MPKMKCPEGVADWVLTFGDMMSLLLCFFIMLYAISTLEVVKAQAAADSISKAFGKKGSKSPFRSAALSSRAKKMRITPGGASVAAPQGDNPRVTNIRDNAEPVRGGIIRFDRSSDELNEQAKLDLENVYDQLIGSPYKVEIRGHASPDEQSVYHDFWDLSYARARAVKEHLVALGLPEKYFRINASGPYEPIGRGGAIVPASPQEVNAVVEVMQLLDTVRDYQGDKKDQETLFINQTPF